jgi:hypothetical protein
VVDPLSLHINSKKISMLALKAAWVDK